MLEIKILSLFVGSLGLQAAIASGWLRWQQVLAAQLRDEEEETLTPYESKDPYTSADSQTNGATKQSKDPRLVGWEFKIVRAHKDLFRDPQIFKRLCEEEAESGWILLEKLDDRRVRFKRPISLREIIRSEFLSHDPYRTHYGPSSNWTALLLATAFLTAILMPAYLGYILVTTTLATVRSNQVEAPSKPAPASALPSNSSSPKQPSVPFQASPFPTQPATSYSPSSDNSTENSTSPDAESPEAP